VPRIALPSPQSARRCRQGSIRSSSTAAAAWRIAVLTSPCVVVQRHRPPPTGRRQGLARSGDRRSRRPLGTDGGL